MYALNIEQGKILKDSRGSYLEILVTLTNNDKDTLFYANYPCSWQNFYKPDNSVLQTEEMLCSKNLTEVHTLAPGNSSTVLLKLYFKYGLPTYEVKFRVGFNLLKVPGLYYSITPEDLNSKKYLWSNSITIEPDPAVVAAAQKKSWINPWEGINGYRFSAGYIKDLEIEASYLVTSYPEKDPGFGGFAMLVHYLGVGAEYVKDGPRNAFGAKLSYEASFNILAAQLGTDYLVTDKDQQLRIMPKVGLCLVCLPFITAEIIIFLQKALYNLINIL
jgi:hypothetical protein